MTLSFGLLGASLGHSLSPKLHTLILRKLRLPASYQLVETKKEHLKSFFQKLKNKEFQGLNVTLPYKEEVLKYLDVLSPLASQIGAINTLSLKDEKIWGYNTDYDGIARTFKRYKIQVKGQDALILGSGGAAKTMALYLKNEGIRKLFLATRSLEEGQKKEQGPYKLISYQDLELLDPCQLLVNCTPLGMAPNINSMPISKAQLKKFKLVFDLIYNPQETLLLKTARDLGLETINGLYMLVSQGVRAQEIWNELQIDDSTLEEIYHEFKGELLL